MARSLNPVPAESRTGEESGPGVIAHQSLFIMRYLLIILLLCTGIAQAQDTIRVLTYNIHHANPPSREGFIDLDAIARVINQQRPHLVALQEVDVHTGRSGPTLHEANELAARTGMQAYFAKAIPHDGGEYGVALLSRYPISEGRTVPLPTEAATKGEPRVLGIITVTLPGGRRIMMASTHLDVLKNDINRLQQIREISRILGNAPLPVILAGDLNAATGSAVIQVLDSTFTRTCDVCAPTIPVHTPNRTIDFITFRPATAFKVLRHEVITERYASDHLPVAAELLLK